MSTTTILMYAIGVFTLMAIGMFLTMLEFNRLTDEPALRKGAGTAEKPDSERPADKIRVVHSNEDAA